MSNPVEVTLEEAYAEACRVIGEQIVTQRLLAKATTPEEPARAT